MRRAGAVVTLVLLGVVVVACGSTKDHSWQGEFIERLEGATAAVERSTRELGRESTYGELLRAGIPLAETLKFKSERIEELSPPAGCEELQESGAKRVSGLALFNYDLEKNATPFLLRHLQRDIREQLVELEELEREAAHCASG
jgi:hypothetical protein